MTNPQSDALDALSRLAAGNSNVVSRPNLMAELVNGNASQADAGVINTFVGALQAENAVDKLRQSGQRSYLPPSMIASLNAVGAQYQDVYQSQQAADAAAVKRIAASGQVPVFNNGLLIGGRAKTQHEDNADHGGWFGGFGDFWHHLTHNPVTDVIGDGYNILNSVVQHGVNPGQAIQDDAQNAALMTSMGYDPTSAISTLAYDAKGYRRTQLDPLLQKYGADQVTAAQKYLADPKSYTENLIADANKQDPTGKLAQQKVAQLDSKEFGNTIQELVGHNASVGTDVALNVGLDPVKNSGAFRWVSGGIDTVSSFFLDPTIVAGKIVGAARVAQIGIHGYQDSTRIAHALDVANSGVFARQVQRGFQTAVDSGNKIREGQAAMEQARLAGDLEQYAKSQTQVTTAQAALNRVNLAGLEPALVGTHRVVGLDPENPGMLKFAEGGEPLDTYNKLFQYVTADKGLLDLQAGKAVVESTLMPGAMSRFGAKFVRGALDGATAGRRTAYNFRKLEAATKLLPSATDAVDVASMEHLSQAQIDVLDESGLASASRARQFPSGAQLGEAEYNARRYGNFAGTGVLGSIAVKLPVIGEITPGSWVNPAAIVARSRLARARLNVTNILPRNNKINLLDELGHEQIGAFARTYLPRDQALMAQSAYATADFGGRRAILHGIKAQVFHAAGLYHSEPGREFADKWLADDLGLYGHTEDGVMPVDPWTGAQDLSSALWAEQNRLDYTIPSFGQMHTLAAKMGLYESTVGRALTSHIADALGSAVRFAILTTPRTAVRATVEGWVNLLARGDARRALAAKAHSGDFGFLPARGRTLTAATGWFLPRAVGKYIKLAEKRGMTDHEFEFLQRIYDNHPEIAEQVQHSLSQHLLEGDIHPLEASYNMLDHAKAGFQSVKWERDGWKAQSTAGYEGAGRLETALALRAHGNPKTFPAVLDYLADPSAESMMRVKDAMLDPAEYAQFRRMRWANVYTDTQGVLRRALTEDEKQIALEQHAGRLVNDMRHLTSDASGQLSKPLVDKLRTGEGASQDWINENLSNELRPPSAIAPSYMAKIVDAADDMPTARQKIAGVLQDLSGKAYKKFVVDPAERMTSMPAFWGNYVKARVEMADVGVEKRMVEEGGYSPEAADTLLMHRAIRQAWVRTEATIDDPGLKTQIDIVGRNLFGFPRAINAFIRRYGQLVKQDPTVIRKGMLAVQGAEQMGFVYKDQNGELTYTVPGTGFLVNALNDLGKLMGWENFIALPSGDLTGKVLMSAPGFDNPIRPSMSPMLNIPFRWFANMFPDHRQMVAEIDTILNGQKGSGRTWQQSLMPAAFSHFYEAMSGADRNSLLASATIGAFANLVAADPNGTRGILPQPGSDPSGAKLQAFMGTLKTQVRNQLYVRAALGLILPGSPSRPSDATDGSHPDEAYFIRGARSLDEEFKMMINDYKGDYSAALQAFISLHPNGLVYTMPTSTVTAAGLNLPSTRQSEAWMEQNYSTIEKYPLVAAYFAPKTDGKFDANAWQAQLANGLRQKKSVNDFVQSYELKRSQAIYFQAYDQMKQAKDEATAQGDLKRARFLSSNFTDQMQPFLAANPVMRQWLTIGDAQKTVQAQQAIGQLRDLLASGAAPKIQGTLSAAKMLQAWDVHEQYQHDRINHDPSARQYESQAFAQFMLDTVRREPDMAGLYGVFRAVDYTALPSINTPTAGGA